MRRILFVCTGNTCRSPLAEALCRKLLADKLSCPEEQLAECGFEVRSAGVATHGGQPASFEAVEILRGLGGGLSDHQSQPLTMEMWQQADYVFAMTDGHLRLLESVQTPDLPQPVLLSPDGADVADPIGGTPEDYRVCADQIRAFLDHRLEEILNAQSPGLPSPG